MSSGAKALNSAVAAALLLFAGTACGNRLLTSSVIQDVDSSQNVKPGNFTVNGKWDLVYSWDCSRQRSERMSDINRFAMTIYYTDDMSTAFEHPYVKLTGAGGKGVLHYQRGGEYKVVPDTPCDWRIQVVDQST